MGTLHPIAAWAEPAQTEEFIADYRTWVSLGRADRASGLAALLEKWDLDNREHFVQCYHSAQRIRERELGRKPMPPLKVYPDDNQDILDADERFWSDKKIAHLNWREVIEAITPLQAILHNASGAQDHASIDFSHINRPICVVGLSDLHMGSWGTDYETLLRVTDEILSTEDLYVAALGDFLQMAIKMRSVLEVSDNAIPPAYQDMFLESWLEEIYPKVLFATWDNHAVMRQESQAGSSSYSTIFKRRCIYHNGIGHVDLRLGDETYKIAASHRFAGRSMTNPVHGQMRYARMEAPDREIIMAGDSHVPGYTQYVEGGSWRTVLNGGTLQSNSGYAKRFFSLSTHPEMPCVQLYPDEHRVIPFRTVGDWLAVTGRTTKKAS